MLEDVLEILSDEKPTLETKYFIFKYILYINGSIQNIHLILRTHAVSPDFSQENVIRNLLRNQGNNVSLPCIYY